jgi:hypothetical protein
MEPCQEPSLPWRLLHAEVEQVAFKFAARAVIDDLTDATADVRRQRIFTIAVYSAAESHGELVGATGLLKASLALRGYRFIGQGLSLRDGSYGAVLFAETPEPVTNLSWPEGLPSAHRRKKAPTAPSATAMMNPAVPVSACARTSVPITPLLIATRTVHRGH